MALESYLRVFEEEDALDRFETFASEFGPAFYGLPLNESRVLLRRTNQAVPDLITRSDEQVVPFHAGQTLSWKFEGVL